MTNPFALDTPAAPAAAAPVAAPPATPASTPASQSHAAPAGGDDPFDGPAPQAPRGPRLREMYGRLLLVVPRKLEEGIPNRLGKPGDTQDRMTADVVVLDGGPINYGGKPEAVPPTPHDKVAQIPHKTERMYISSAGLISQSRKALAKLVTEGRPGMVLGRLTKGAASEKGEPPWLLDTPTDADKAIARAYLSTVDPFA